MADAAEQPGPAPRPLYHQVKQYVIGRIESGEWLPGQRVPSEHEVMRTFGVSRQTANRALHDLTTEGYLVRVQGVGSFVANVKYQSAALVVGSISDEIASRGHEHRAQVLRLERVAASDLIAWALDLPAGAPVFHSLILHLDDGVPLQLEDRFVNPAAAPDYLDEDFTRVTPNQHLMRVRAPISEVEESIEAALADPDQCRWLGIDPHRPCLVVRRRTWSGSLAVTQVTLTHPGDSYRLRLHFRPGERIGT
ncbi:MAG: histidine utilization repressor [Chloroflexota bacterium]